jgi:hypothetical protein
MFESKLCGCKIKISLENGFYIFEDEAALGKTHLANLLKKLGSFGEAVDAYSFSDYRLGVSLDKILEKDLKVLLIDRYDLYEGFCIQSLTEKSKDCIVLVDLKYITRDFTNVNLRKDRCTIVLGEGSIEVI